MSEPREQNPGNAGPGPWSSFSQAYPFKDASQGLLS